MSTPDSNYRVAIVSAATSIITALITAAVTLHTAGNSAVKSAQDATGQATIATNAASRLAANSEALVPAGAVLAFDTPNGCPSGWEVFASGAGRVIVGEGAGIGLTVRPYRTVGGEERHQLSIQELPSHFHSCNVGTRGTSFEHHQENSRMPSSLWHNGTGETGGNASHENMQPFIVLKYCKKA